MPIFDFKCNSCGHIDKDEWFPHISKIDTYFCSKCGSLSRKLMTVANCNRIAMKCIREFGHDLKGQKK